MSLFNFKENGFILHSGNSSDFKLDCDSLTDEDWYSIAAIILKHKHLGVFGDVVGVPRGGEFLAKILMPFSSKHSCVCPCHINSLLSHNTPCCGIKKDGLLIVDDVLTTGQSIKETAQNYQAENPSQFKGFVVFSRAVAHTIDLWWVHSLFAVGTNDFAAIINKDL